MPRGCRGGGAEGKESTLVGACREGKGREEEGVEREAGGVPKAGDSSSAGGSIKHPKKTFRTLSFLFRGKD